MTTTIYACDEIEVFLVTPIGKVVNSQSEGVNSAVLLFPVVLRNQFQVRRKYFLSLQVFFRLIFFVELQL